MKQNYTANLGSTMAYEWWKGRRNKYWELEPKLHMSVTGSKTKKKYGLGPFPT